MSTVGDASKLLLEPLLGSLGRKVHQTSFCRKERCFIYSSLNDFQEKLAFS